jgi:hypothetical protein
LCGGPLTNRAREAYEDSFGTSYSSRVSYQLEENQDRTNQDSGISRLRIQHHGHEDQGPLGEVKEIGTPTPPGQNYSIMQVDGRLTREDNSNAASDWGRLTRHSINSTGFILLSFISFSYVCKHIIAYVTFLIRSKLSFMMNLLKFTFLESFSPSSMMPDTILVRSLGHDTRIIIPIPIYTFADFPLHL